MEQDAATTRGRGRPRSSTPEELRAKAIEVMMQVGYEGATIEAIAAHAGVSTRTVHRYFPSKAEMVWGGTEASIASLREGFATVSDDLPTITAIVQVVSDTFTQTPDEAESMRARLRLIALTPELRTVRSSLFHEWHHELAAFVARRSGDEADDLLPQVTATSVQEAIMAALGWWAVHNDPREPHEVLIEVFERGFAQGFGA